MRVTKLFLKYIFYLTLAFLLLRGLLIFVIGYSQVNNGRSLDLRNRIVGTRVALLGKDPYFYIEQPGGDERFIDPMVFPNSTQTRLTITPSALLVNIPFVGNDYALIINIWYLCQWIFLILSLFLISKSYELHKKSLLTLLFFATLVTISQSWRMHLIAGQIYVLYLFLLSLFLFFYNSSRYRLSFIILGILTITRLPYAFLALVLFMFEKHIKYFKYFSFAIILILSTTVVLFNKNVWGQYVDSMFNISERPVIYEKIESHYPQKYYSERIEGWNIPQHSLGMSPELELSLKTYVFERTGHSINNSSLFAIVSILYTFGLISIFYRIRKRKYVKNYNEIIVIAITVVLLSEYFLPARRYIYSDIVWVLPISYLYFQVTNYIFKNEES